MLPDKALKIYKVSEEDAKKVVSAPVNKKDWVWSGGFMIECQCIGFKKELQCRNIRMI